MARAVARGLAQGLARALYPPACLACGARTEGASGLCGPCWREARFWGGGLACDLCGAPLPGAEGGAGPNSVPCDDCLRHPRPWDRGRAALPYAGPGRALALRLKHGDRTDLARPLGLWLARAARPLLGPDQVLVPVPLHWSRLAVRRYNQAQLLAAHAGAALGRPVMPDALVRGRRTPALGREGPAARAAALAGSIAPHPRRGAALAGRSVVLVDDVLTTGATLGAAAAAARAAGAREVAVLVLARALREAPRDAPGDP